jgi:hypothetical protein
MGAACSAGTLVAAGPSFLDPRVLALTGAIAGALLLGAIILALVDRWRKKQMNDTRNVQEELATYRALYQRGELSAAEYERVRTRLVDRLKTKPKPATVTDPETGKPPVVEDPTAPVVPTEPDTPTPPDAPPPDAPTL